MLAHAANRFASETSAAIQRRFAFSDEDEDFCYDFNYEQTYADTLPSADLFYRTQPILLRRAAVIAALQIKLIGACADLLFHIGCNLRLRVITSVETVTGVATRAISVLRVDAISVRWRDFAALRRLLGRCAFLVSWCFRHLT